MDGLEVDSTNDVQAVVAGVDGLRVGKAMYAKPVCAPDKYKDSRLPKADGARLVESVKLGEPELKKSTLSSYYAYKLSLTCSPDLNVDFVERRFSEFVWLREQLEKCFPGIFIPPLPPKKMVGNKEAGFVAERREDLQRFLDRVVERKFLADSLPFQMFVSRPRFDAGKKIVEQEMKKISYKDQVEIYKELFPEICAADLPANPEERIQAFNTFVTNEDVRLESLYNTTHSIGIGWLNMIKDTSTLSQELLHMKTLENEFVLRPEPARPDISAVFNQWSDSVKQIAPVYYTHLYTTFKHESQDCVAFIDLMKNRNRIHLECSKAVASASQWKGTNYNSAKETPKSIAQKEFDLEQEKSLIELLDQMTKIILNYELPRIWKKKVLMYHENMSHFATCQHNNVKGAVSIWGDVKDILE